MCVKSEAGCINERNLVMSIERIKAIWCHKHKKVYLNNGTIWISDNVMSGIPTAIWMTKIVGYSDGNLNNKTIRW